MSLVPLMNNFDDIIIYNGYILYPMLNENLLPNEGKLEDKQFYNLYNRMQPQSEIKAGYVIPSMKNRTMRGSNIKSLNY